MSAGTHYEIQTSRRSSPEEIVGPAPELRFSETDQTDPAGRWRIRVDSDALLIENAATASWATSTSRVRFNAAYNITLFQATANYTLAWSDPGAARTLTIPDPGASDTFTFLAATQTFLTGVKTFNSSILAIRNPADTFSYTIVASAITAARNLTIPLITADDTLAVLGLAQTFTADPAFTRAGETFIATNTQDAASVLVATFQGQRTTQAANDEAYITFALKNSTPIQQSFARLTWRGTNITSGSEAGRLDISLMKAGVLTNLLQYASGALAFQESVTISTTTGNLVLTPSSIVQMTKAAITGPVRTSAWGGFAAEFDVDTGQSANADAGLLIAGSRTVDGSTATLLFGNWANTATMTNIAAIAARRSTGDTGGLMRFQTTVNGGALTTRLTIDDVGRSQFGTTAPYSTLVAGGLGVASGVMIGADSLNNLFNTASGGAGSTTMYIGNASINVTSDIRLKQQVAPSVLVASEGLRKLQVKDFWWDDPSDLSPNNRNSRGQWTGLIAQEVAPIFPFLVNAPNRHCPLCSQGKSCSEHPVENGPWRIEYPYMVPVLVKGWQEHEKRLDGLEERIRDLEEALR